MNPIHSCGKIVRQERTIAVVNLAHLRYFWAVAHEGNLTRAADSLHVSQSAVSVQIRKLEEALGHALFDRRGRQLVLNAAGRVALDHADTIFSVGDQLASALRTGVREPSLALRVGALATLSRNFQLAFLAPILAREDIGLTIRSGPFGVLLRQLESHRIDVLLTNLTPPRDRGVPWVPHRIAQQPVSLIGHPRRVGGRRNWRSLLTTEPLVVPTLETSIRAAFDALVHRLQLRPRIAAEVDDMAMLRLLARQDVGLAVIPSIVVQDELAARSLVEVARLPGMIETFWAITLPRALPNPALAALLPDADRRPTRAPAKRRRPLRRG